MSRMLKFPSIEQFRNVVKNVQNKAQYKGQDDFGEAIMDRHAKMPTLKFEGTVKGHGTNAGVCCSADGEMWVQSRENIITPMKDNAGFAMFVQAREDAFNDLLVTARAIPELRKGTETVAIFGEFLGKGIQKGVAVSELPKTFIIFAMALVDGDERRWFTRKEMEDVVDCCREYVLRPNGKIPETSNIYFIYDFPIYNIEIDFENPHNAQNILNEWTEKVGDECPIGKAFGIESACGEGIVYRCTNQGWEDSGLWFKVKDDRHSNSKVKTLATVDVERFNSINELAERLAHNGRLEQAAQNVFDTLNGGEVDIKKMGEMIKFVMQDIFREDIDIIAESGYTGKELNGPVSKIVRDFVMKQLEV